MSANTNDSKNKEVAYPLYDLSEAVRVAEAVRDLGGGNAPVAKSLLAQQLELAETGPSFFQRVSSAKAFGLVDGWGSYSLTEIAKQYFYPTVENGQEQAAIKLLTNPKAFSILVQKFDGGKLPAVQMMGNIIHKEAGIPVSKKDTVAAIFARSVQFLKVIDPSGFLRCRAFVAGGAGVVNGGVKTPPKDPPPPPPPPPPRGTGYEKSFDLGEEPGTREVILNCPRVITKSELERIFSWIKVTWVIKEDEKPQ